jgi:hypothetical protein
MLNYRVILLGGFNVPGFDWNCGLLSPKCHFYAKLKGDLIHSATCFLDLNQDNYSDNGSNLRDPVISILLLSLTVQCQFDVINKILRFLRRDFLLGIMQCFIMPCLLISGLHCTTKHLLMLPLTD